MNLGKKLVPILQEGKKDYNFDLWNVMEFLIKEGKGATQLLYYVCILFDSL